MHQHFHRSYESARRHFLALCSKTDASIEHLKHPKTGPDGELFTDVAIWGDRSCEHLIVITSATHGIEGYAGSGLQSLLIAEGLSRRLPSGTSLMMIHAVNPYGFAWQRRVNESNIDLNRNFIDHSRPPANQPYLEIAKLLEPETWGATIEADIQKQFTELSRKNGARWLQGAMTKGQYTHPNGFFYGGAAPAWSNKLMHLLGQQYLYLAERVSLIDIHTALGDFGAAECITTYPLNSDEYQRSKAIWGDQVRSTDSGESLSVDVNGPMVNAMQQYSDFLGIGLEFGTIRMAEVTMALIADQWLHHHGSLDMNEGHPIKERMMAAFYPDSIPWRESIAAITRGIIEQTLTREK